MSEKYLDSKEKIAIKKDCLKKAVIIATHFTVLGEPVLSIAQKYYDWVTGKNV